MPPPPIFVDETMLCMIWSQGKGMLYMFNVFNCSGKLSGKLLECNLESN